MVWVGIGQRVKVVVGWFLNVSLEGLLVFQHRVLINRIRLSRSILRRIAPATKTNLRRHSPSPFLPIFTHTHTILLGIRNELMFSLLPQIGLAIFKSPVRLLMQDYQHIILEDAFLEAFARDVDLALPMLDSVLPLAFVIAAVVPVHFAVAVADV